MNEVTQKKYAPSAERNQKPILAVLEAWLPDHGTILEIASGSGQHASYFIPHLPNHYWLPSDPSPENRDSISTWWWDIQMNNILPPLDINTCNDVWAAENINPPLPITAMVCINMIHISPWPSTIGLMKGAERILPPGGILYLYGPYKIAGHHTAPTNDSFDSSLRSRNPDWGIRDVEAVESLAGEYGLILVKTVNMPANNLSVIFKKT